MMNLKRAIIKTFLTASLLFASCSPFNSHFAVYEEDSFNFEDYIAVRAVLANYRAVKKDSGELHSSQSDARLIRPELSVNDYKFYIYGQKSLNDTKNIFGPYDITSQLESSGDSGEFEVNVPKGIWYMTLIAVNTELKFTASDIATVTSKALLMGSCMADLQNESSNSNFILSDAGLTTPGTINLTLTPDNWSLQENISARAGLYYLKTGKPVENTEQTLTITGNDISNYAPKDEGTLLEVKPGSYSFRLTFFDDKGENWIWSDQIHIFPGRETDQKIFIPKVINEIPAAPKNFAFTRDNLPSDQSDYYSGTFTWGLPETGTTATEYELRLWDEGANKLYKTYTTKNLNTILYKAGGLNAQDTSITLWLPMGKNLSAQLRAKNRTGTSDEDWSSSKKVENINLYRVTYNLQGGSVQNDSVFGSGTSGTTGAVCRYGSVSNPLQWIIPGANDITDSDGNRFDFWSTTTAEDAPALDTDENEGKYAGYENVNLYAHYKEFISHPLDGNDITIKYGNDESTAPIPESDTINFAKGDVLKIIIIPPDGFRYKNKKGEDSVKLKLKKTDGDELSNFTFDDTLKAYLYSRPTDDLNSGNYEITLMAEFYNQNTYKLETSLRTIKLIISE